MSNSRGFTLIEVLVVVALLAILAVAGLVGWNIQTQKARDAARKSSLQQLSGALLSYYDDFGCYPEEAEMACESNILSPYMDMVPCDPINNDTHKYTYVKEDCRIFYVYAKLEVESDPAIAKAGCNGGCGPEGDKNYNYLVTSGNVSSGGSGFGVSPTCGTGDNLYCFPAVCGTCCPGSAYRCNLNGTACLLDVTCNL